MMMDSFGFDLDKALDQLEESEDQEVNANGYHRNQVGNSFGGGGQMSHPELHRSGFGDSVHLKASDGVEPKMDPYAMPPLQQEKLDLSEADFGPTPPIVGHCISDSGAPGTTDGNLHHVNGRSGLHDMDGEGYFISEDGRVGIPPSAVHSQMFQNNFQHAHDELLRDDVVDGALGKSLSNIVMPLDTIAAEVKPNSASEERSRDVVDFVVHKDKDATEAPPSETLSDSGLDSVSTSEPGEPAYVQAWCPAEAAPPGLASLSPAHISDAVSDGGAGMDSSNGSSKADKVESEPRDSLSDDQTPVEIKAVNGNGEPSADASIPEPENDELKLVESESDSAQTVMSEPVPEGLAEDPEGKPDEVSHDALKEQKLETPSHETISEDGETKSSMPPKATPVGFQQLDDVDMDVSDSEMDAYLALSSSDVNQHSYTKPSIAQEFDIVMDHCGPARLATKDMHPSSLDKFGSGSDPQSIEEVLCDATSARDADPAKADTANADAADADTAIADTADADTANAETADAEAADADAADANAADADAADADATEADAVDDDSEMHESVESIEKFFVPPVVSPMIATPWDDAGFSKVPGFTPELSIMEEDEETVDVMVDDRAPSQSLGALSDVPRAAVESGTTARVTEVVVDNDAAQGGPAAGVTPAIITPSAIASAAPFGGVRPKETPTPTKGGKTIRPSSLLGLSTPDLSMVTPASHTGILGPPTRDSGIVADFNYQSNEVVPEVAAAMNEESQPSESMVAQAHKGENAISPQRKKRLNLDIKQKIDSVEAVPVALALPEVSPSGAQVSGQWPTGGATQASPAEPQLQRGFDQLGDDSLYTGDQAAHYSATSHSSAQPAAEPVPLLPSGVNAGPGPVHSSTTVPSRHMRPSSLDVYPNQAADAQAAMLSSGILPVSRRRQDGVAVEVSEESQNAMPVGLPVSGTDTGPTVMAAAQDMAAGAEASSASSTPPGPSPERAAAMAAPPTSANINLAITQLGRVAPDWVPDAEAPHCMQCEVKFTFTKRRHHCRACGKVFCNPCCNLRSKLQYMDNKEVRVCSKCYQDLIRAQAYERRQLPIQGPNPNNPSNQRRSELPKQVMFSDGIRPGGDLTELDGSAELPQQRPGRKSKRVEKTDDRSASRAKTVSSADGDRNQCLIPDVGLPPVVISTGVKGDISLDENPEPETIMPQIKSTDDPSPVVFAINKNLHVLVKIVKLDCCVNRVCWCFTTKGMCTVAQDEMVIVLECLPDEAAPPRDIFCHFNAVYIEASKGNTVSHLGHTIFAQGFLDSRDHGGFLYIRPIFQCLQRLLLPAQPYVFGVLLQKWETPWAKVFPLRLMLRLGAEYRYYPCPLISVRYRKPVYAEIGHTIMNLLVDFRNYQYMLPQVRGVTVHMEDKKTYLNFPSNRYDDVMKVLNNSNDHVMALGATFSQEADSHLVCMQNDDGNYQTQAINIQNKPRQITGASFVVFNGALKQSSGLRAKSSIVEDGLMVQITPEAMVGLKQALKDMQDYTIGCGSLDLAQPEEWVVARWKDDDKDVNIGVRSPIDDMSMDGIDSIHIHNATDYVGENRTIRWTEVFFIQSDVSSSRCEPVDMSRLAETLATATCIALTPHLDRLKEDNLTKIGLRGTIDPEKTCYEVGSNGARLPDQYMDDLDNALIPVIHNAASQSQEAPVVLELIFYVIE